IVGLVYADCGEITLDGQYLTPLAMHERARSGIGYLPQEPSIFRKLSVEDNILGILEMRKDLGKAQQKAKMESLLEEFNIQHIRKNMGMSLSGGERRRVEIARALATEPKFILLDEPFAGVDPISVNDIKQTILHLQSKGIGILITDHNVRETLDICEKAYIVNDGFILASGTPDEILNNEQVKAAYLGDKFSL
ncbi:MAG: LPS export ABC transporter ATP-binding protein, partial [Pseudomonadales bacterium]|nr:LPS export ABC transporter ATP-binding protein [Pseudomonadales bacterium]